MSSFVDKSVRDTDLMRPEEDVQQPRQETAAGIAALQELAKQGRPAPDQVAALLAQHPRETDEIVGFVQRSFGNAFTDEVLARPASVDLNAAARQALDAGVHDENKLTNEVFWQRYPGLRGRRLTPGTPLSKEWLAIRDDVVRRVVVDAQPQTEARSQSDARPKDAPKPDEDQQQQQQQQPQQEEEQEQTQAQPQPQAQAQPQKQAKTPIHTLKEEAKVLNEIRASKKRLDPGWLAAAQNVAGATPTGGMNTETLRAFRKLTGNDKLGSKDILAEGFLADQVPGAHFHQAGPMTHVKAEKNPKATDEFDQVARIAGAASYEDWQSKWVAITFLGKTLGQGHPHLAGRLQVAEEYLKNKHGSDKSPAELRGLIGWDGTGNAHYYDLGLHMHSMGLAIDISPSKNPWVFRGKKEQIDSGQKKGDTADDFYEKLFIIATNVYGGEPITSKQMWTWSQELSSDELWEKIHTSSEAIRKYMDLTKADDATYIATLVASGKYTEDQAKSYAGRRKWHWQKFHDSDRGQAKAEGITNISQDLLVALRDVAGLAWGAGEFTDREGGMNGDMMHFDCRNDAVGGRILHAILGTR
jgi:hypothetical protein